LRGTLPAAVLPRGRLMNTRRRFVMKRAAVRRTTHVLLATIVAFTWYASPPLAAATSSSSAVHVWLTDLGSANRLTRQADLAMSPSRSVTASTIGVDEGRTYQSMVGFGAAFTDSSAWLVYNSLTTSQRAALMSDLFDPKAGIGLDMIRVPMGASDFSVTGNYSYDDMPAGQTDPTLANFSIGHDLAYIVPVLKQLRAINPKVTLMANPWSPPGWMKTSDSMVGGTLKPEDFGALAQYFVKFLQGYEAQGVHINYITPQNEPLYIPGTYPGMGMVPADQEAFIRDYLAPSLATAGLKTGIFAYDHNWEEPGYPETVYSDPSAAAKVAGTAWHCYAGDVAAQTAVHNAYPNESTHETECSGGSWQGTDQQAFDATMALLVNSPRNYAQDVLLWNVALDASNGPTNNGCLTCRGVVTIAGSGGSATVTKNVDYYALGQFSKFVVPGAVRIGSSSLADGSIENVAFRNPDGSKVLVAHNTTASARTFRVQWGGKRFSYTLGGGAAVTFTWNGRQYGNTPRYASLARSVDIPFENVDGSKVQLTYNASQEAFQNSILSGTTQFTYTLPVGATIAAGGAETPLSRTGWTVSASSSSGDVPANAIDGDASTRWSSRQGQSNGDWFQVDMGSPQAVSGLLIDSAANTGDFARYYQVYISIDGLNWGSAIASGPGAGQLARVVFPTVTTRFIRVVQLGSTGNWWSIAEFNAFTATSQPAGHSSLEQRSFRAPNGASGLAVYNPKSTSAKFNVEPWSHQSLVYTIPARGGAIFTWFGTHGGATLGAPVLTSLDPTAGLPSQAVVLAGSGFGSSQGASSVKIGSEIAAVLSWTNTAITALVPRSEAAGPTTFAVTVVGRTSAALPFTVQSASDALPRTGWVATTSSTDPYGDVPANMLDGNAATRWSSGHGQTNGDWIQFDMGSAQTFTRIAMDSGPSTGDYARGYQVFVSNDGSTWGSAVAAGTGNGPLIVAAFAPQTARFVRVVETGESGSWWSIAEFYAFA
jgi:O-glycosyl hydrolase